jgi:DMSO reductase anchor subunit
MVISMIIAGSIFGALLPEWLLVISNNARIKEIPLSHTFLSAIALGIVFGFIAGEVMK